MSMKNKNLSYATLEYTPDLSKCKVLGEKRFRIINTNIADSTDLGITAKRRTAPHLGHKRGEQPLSLVELIKNKFVGG
jgi:hypothetical protein